MIIIAATIIYPHGNGCHTRHHKHRYYKRKFAIIPQSGFTWRIRKSFHAVSRAKFIHLPNLLERRGKEIGREVRAVPHNPVQKCNLGEELRKVQLL